MEILKKAETIIRNAVDGNQIPGAQYGFVSLGHEEYSNYGYKQIVPNKLENDIATLYDMASCTKVIATTTLILKLIEENKLSLQTRVADILTDFPYKDITIQMCLTHTSGMVSDDKAYKECKDSDDIYEFIKRLPLAHEPLAMVEYSDFAFIILGFIIDELTGSIEDYANKIIFEPLGMNDTMYNPYLKGRKDDCACTEISEARGLIQGVVHDGKAFILNGLSGNAGLFSNVKDLAKFTKMILNDGQPILKKKTVELFKRCYTQGMNLHRTLGWCVACGEYSCGSKYSNCAVFHTGFSGTSIYIDFVRKCAIILLTNRIHPLRQDIEIISSIRNAFHDAVLEEFDK